MICYRCDNEAGKDDYCPNCGADLRLFQKAVRMSNVYYNDGLEKARVRNLSGAITSLQTSLRFYKYNIDARNLLGLIYYEMGDCVDAMSEWVISRNYKFKDNLASHYLNEIQKNKTELSNIESSVKKYNQALEYAQQGSLDMAFMQLKKVLSINPRMVKAHQMMALLYIEQGKYEQAKKSLRLAGRIDTNNTLTLRYLHEVNQALLNARGNKKKKDDDLISYQSGNEMIIMPKRFRESSLGASLAYIILGVVIGIAAAFFLIVPESESEAVSSAQQQLAAANQSLAAGEQTISTLQEQVDSLNSELAEATAENDDTTQLESCEALLAAYAAHASENDQTAGEELLKVDTELLSDDAKAVYDTISEDILTAYLALVYESGYDAFSDEDYDTAITELLIVTGQNMGYEDGAAAFYLAESYRQSGDAESAASYYEYLIANFPSSSYAETAQEYVTVSDEEDTESSNEEGE